MRISIAGTCTIAFHPSTPSAQTTSAPSAPHPVNAFACSAPPRGQGSQDGRPGCFGEREIERPYNSVQLDVFLMLVPNTRTGAAKRVGWKETHSGYATSTNLCLFVAFSKRFRSKPACSIALVCKALVSSQSSFLDRYLLITLEMAESSPSLGMNW